jgi:hypothetical protein
MVTSALQIIAALASSPVAEMATLLRKLLMSLTEPAKKKIISIVMTM